MARHSVREHHRTAYASKCGQLTPSSNCNFHVPALSFAVPTSACTCLCFSASLVSDLPAKF
eukprot:3252765-Pleurochrysis_carterae.AAC.2